ncbi:16S rRNA (guanine(966)-N(2))-methyltransferase RsmD [Idiomarina seosinensis]|uniref:16S rRNA (guanine(966)-N(2))-methyltransferase RsmD n=1 Tax=Idiomarina seosinensis TaxID=281739 RepID=UPI00385166E5
MNKSAGQLRIIAGQWRGTKLPVIDHQGLRPTTSRIRETVFNWLQFDIHNAKVLDLFAGSGSLGFEAASRGAQKVLFIEQDQQAAKQLADNIKRLKADNIDLIQGDALTVLDNHSALPAPADIVFIDPPFHQQLALKTLAKLATSAALTSQSLVYLEVEQQARLDLQADWRIIKDKQHGAVRFLLLQRINNL